MTSVRGWHLWAGLMLATAVTLFLRTPIVARDLDLWFHLGHGRYFFEHGRIPSTTYFSFITPVREWVDYSWLFQVLVYPLWQATGYGGLVVARATLFAAALAMVAWFLLKGRRTPVALAAASFLFSLYLLALAGRYLMVRPHAFSYLFIVVFLYVLELDRRLLPVLPAVAVAWVNLHGAEYPALVLICLAYLGGHYLHRFSFLGLSGPRPAGPAANAGGGDLRIPIALGLSLAAVYATPHGPRLLGVPFIPTHFTSLYNNEMRRLDPRHLVSFEWSWQGFPPQTAFNLLLFASLAAAAAMLVRRRGSWSQLLLLAGGVVLLVKGARFQQEYVLLALPAIRSVFLERLEHGASHANGVRSRRPALLLAALSVAGLWSLPAEIPGRAWAWPLANVNLPDGVTRFLEVAAVEHGTAGGEVMNHPNHGGYLLWKLPDYRIYMDMEVPLLFTDEEMYRAWSFYTDPEALRSLLAEYRPAFVFAPYDFGGFPLHAAAHSDYARVFFDDVGALYADRRRHPELVERYRLRHVDPHGLRSARLPELEPEDVPAYLAELDRVLAIAPVDGANQAAAILRNRRGEFDAALRHAEAVIARSPRLTQGRLLRGDALSGLGRLDEAIAAYRRAVRLAETRDSRRRAYRALAIALSRAGDERRAYRALKKGVALYDGNVPYLDLYNLGQLALSAGNPDEALLMFRFALLKVPTQETEWRRRIEEAIAVLAPVAY